MSMHFLAPLGAVSAECASNPHFQMCRAAGGSESECERENCATGERVPIEVIEAEDRQDYPWMQRAPLTCDLQARINRTLEDEGYRPIAQDCVLGAQTCGAARALLFEYEPATCQAWTDPVLKTEEPPPPPPVVEAPPVAPVTPVTPTRKGLSKASMWAIGGLVAAVVIGGGYYLTQKRAA